MIPEAASAEAFEAIARDEAALAPVVAGALAEGRQAGAVRRFEDGSLPVYALGEDRVLKLYPPVYADEQSREATVLAVLHGRLSIPTPALVASGWVEGWGYVVMQRLRGQSAAVAWTQLPDADRVALMAQLGEALATLHALRDPRLAGVSPKPWAGFIEEERGQAVAKQRRRSVDPLWLEQIDAFLASVELGAAPPDSLLHTEVMREHLLVEPTPSGAAFSGLFDFEPARVGMPEYDFASVGQFVTCADPALLGPLLRAYGYADAELDEALARRLLAHALLHKYSNLAWYMRRNPLPPGVVTLEALALHWYGAG